MRKETTPAVRTHALRQTAPRAGLSIGTSSVLVIFVLLCLVTFAVLSLVSARADSRLSEKNEAHVQEYYAAESTAYAQLSALDEALHTLYEQPELYGEALNALAGQSVAGWQLKTQNQALYAELAVPVNAAQQLNILLLLPQTPTAQGALYRIESWRLCTAGEWQPEDQLPVYGAGAALPEA